MKECGIKTKNCNPMGDNCEECVSNRFIMVDSKDMVSDRELEPYQKLFKAVLETAVEDALRPPHMVRKYPKNHILNKNEIQNERNRLSREDERDRVVNTWFNTFDLDNMNSFVNICMLLGLSRTKLLAEVNSGYAKIRLKTPHTADLSH